MLLKFILLALLTALSNGLIPHHEQSEGKREEETPSSTQKPAGANQPTGTITFLINWSTSELNRQLNPGHCTNSGSDLLDPTIYMHFTS